MRDYLAARKPLTHVRILKNTGKWNRRLTFMKDKLVEDKIKQKHYLFF